ncbi:tyrosine-type recombinase/integrase [Vagococcus sp.]|uniref:tyrosine-type recombinase/integrase n=1 Tax=Vagococcus sp. TaxID=1933889 RepID=UPI002FCB414E
MFTLNYERVLKEFLLELKLQNYSKRTIETYQQHHNKFIKFYKKEIDETIIISDIERVHYKLFIAELLDCDFKASYINSIIKSHKSFWSYLLRENVVEEHPLVKIKLLKEDEKILTTFNDDEVNRMLNYWKFDSYLGARNKCMIAVKVDAGIRVSELIGIKVKILQKNILEYLEKEINGE